MGRIAPTFAEFVAGAEQSVFGECELAGRSLDTEPLLNGVPYKVHRQSFDVQHRRTLGTFFTGSETARLVAGQLRCALPAGSLVMDPTCGMGDLLLAYAELLPLEVTLKATLGAWGSQLAGLDLDPDLVRLTKARLVLQARLRGGFTQEVTDLDAIFPAIRAEDMMASSDKLAAADGFLFNPPFGVVKDVEDCPWSAGSVNSAALFLAELVTSKKSAAPVSAILPEVLRSGSRYEAFRLHLETMGLAGAYRALGRFDPWTDVDVFMTLIEAGTGRRIWDMGAQPAESSFVGDKFRVHVGAVVPHRHKRKGDWHRYICAKSTPRWSEGFEPKSSRRFAGTTFQPPFVVVRRTSSPSDRKRAVATVIVGERTVAVENHLLVVLPKDGSLESCLSLLRVLAHQATDEFLNASIRCRHLTTGMVARVPWTENDG